MNDDRLNKEIAEEIEAEKKEAELAEYAPPEISNAQVNAAKYAWMLIVAAVDLATAYAYYEVLSPYWWYALLWFVVGGGGLIFSEWLWERVGNNDKQNTLARRSKAVSAIAVFVMALLMGVAVVFNFQHAALITGLAVVSSVGLAFFHAWQAYQYHDVDDERIALNLEAQAEAKNQKEERVIHRAGRRVAAKKRVHILGGKYQAQHGEAFQRETGRTFASEAKNPTPGRD